MQAMFGNHVCVCVCIFFFFFSRVCETCGYCSHTVHEQQPQSLTFLTFFSQSVHTVHCSWTHKFHFLAIFLLKMGPMILFTYLKIILLKYFLIFVSKRTLKQLKQNYKPNNFNSNSPTKSQTHVAPWTQAHAQLLDPSMSKPMPKLSKTSHFLNLCYNLIFIFKNSIDISTTKNP